MLSPGTPPPPCKVARPSCPLTPQKPPDKPNRPTRPPCPHTASTTVTRTTAGRTMNVGHNVTECSRPARLSPAPQSRSPSTAAHPTKVTQNSQTNATVDIKRQSQRGQMPNQRTAGQTPLHPLEANVKTIEVDDPDGRRKGRRREGREEGRHSSYRKKENDAPRGGGDTRPAKVKKKRADRSRRTSRRSWTSTTSSRPVTAVCRKQGEPTNDRSVKMLWRRGWTRPAKTPSSDSRRDQQTTGGCPHFGWVSRGWARLGPLYQVRWRWVQGVLEP